MKIKVSNVNTPNWKEVTVKSRIPEELEKLSEIARNIWWAWNFEATELFRDLDPELWKECGQNPVLLLERMSYEKLEALAKDKVILRRMNDVYTKFRDYLDVKPDENRPSVAYFSMEYGLSSVLKIYSGGLGVLAGDYLKEASDSNVDLCAVGFLYRYGYFTQTMPCLDAKCRYALLVIYIFIEQDFHILFLCLNLFICHMCRWLCI